jgi:hypothetical protein
LTLTNPGTSGVLTYKYVGAGFWQRTIDNNSGISGSFDAFTYGVETPDAALRRTGAASYAVDLLGVKAYHDGVTSLSGTGTLDADFVTSKITTNGQFTEINSSGGLAGLGFWNGEAALASAANNFAGTFSLNVSEQGNWTGRFYGPNTEEVGAAWATNDPGETGLHAVGTLTGRYTADIPTKDTNSTLLNLKYDTGFAAEGAFIDYLHQPGNDTLLFYPLNANYREGIPFSYKVDTQTYTFMGTLGSNGPAQFGPAQLSGALSDSKWAVYQDSNSFGAATLKLYKASGWASSLALSYTGFGEWTLASKDGQNRDETQQMWFFYGLPRSAQGGGQVAVPTMGTATYNGSIFGVGAKDGGSNVADISGTANFAVNFGTESFTGSMSPVATDRVTNAVIQIPVYTFADGHLSAEQITAGINLGATPVGNLQGYFFGPQAQELGASFNIGHADPMNGGADYSMQGIIVGKKD